MPIVKLIVDYTPEGSDRIRKAGRTMHVTQDGAREMIANGIAEISENLYGLPPVAMTQKTTKKKPDPGTTPAPAE